TITSSSSATHERPFDIEHLLIAWHQGNANARRVPRTSAGWFVERNQAVAAIAGLSVAPVDSRPARDHPQLKRQTAHRRAGGRAGSSASETAAHEISWTVRGNARRRVRPVENSSTNRAFSTPRRCSHAGTAAASSCAITIMPAEPLATRAYTLVDVDALAAA